uniref:DUF7950 domain-containing protein n=1 Tax=Kalanchoe fedtschenkoi TaxID=63787 RepID=A0A7N0UTJ9_KALFE
MDLAGGGSGWSDLTKHSSGGGGVGGGRVGGVHQYYHCNSNSALRFRPIAPKPSPNGSTSSSVTFESKRTKRRYVRVKRAAGCKRKSKTSRSNDAPSADVIDTCQKEIVTLQLLPSEPVRASIASSLADRASWVTVECVTGVGTLAAIRTDDETKAALSGDACPAFISSGCDDVVVWVNDAFKRVVMAEEDEVAVAVRLEVDRVWLEGGAAFTCKVRWRYWKGGGMVVTTVMCDTWRVRSGGFAWRLDVCGALSLGLRASC